MKGLDKGFRTLVCENYCHGICLVCQTAKWDYLRIVAVFTPVSYVHVCNSIIVCVQHYYCMLLCMCTIMYYVCMTFLHSSATRTQVCEFFDIVAQMTAVTRRHALNVLPTFTVAGVKIMWASCSMCMCHPTSAYRGWRLGVAVCYMCALAELPWNVLKCNNWQRTSVLWHSVWSNGCRLSAEWYCWPTKSASI